MFDPVTAATIAEVAAAAGPTAATTAATVGTTSLAMQGAANFASQFVAAQSLIPGAGGFTAANAILPTTLASTAIKASTGFGLGNALMLGQAGLSLAAGLGSKSGGSFQPKINLSKEGKAAEKDYITATDKLIDKRASGDVSDIASPILSKMRKQEGKRARVDDASMSALVSYLGNKDPDKSGGAAAGGRMIGAAAGKAGRRVKGLYNPKSIMASITKEELRNALKHAQNLYSLQTQTAQYNYRTDLSNWRAENIADANRGATFGSAIAGVGDWMAKRSFNNREKEIYT